MLQEWVGWIILLMMIKIHTVNYGIGINDIMCDDITCYDLHLASVAGMDDITCDDLTSDDLNQECEIMEQD